MTEAPITYERFTDRSRKVMQLANQEAQRFNHEFIGTEHLLLGIVKEGHGAAATVLRNLKIDLRTIRLKIEETTKTGDGDKLVMGKLPNTPVLKQCFRHAIEESGALGHNYVGTEHLLLGILNIPECVAGQILQAAGLTPKAVRAAVLSLLKGNKAEPEPEVTWTLAEDEVFEVRRVESPVALPPGSHMAVFAKEEGGTRGFLSVPLKHPELRTWTCDVPGDFAEAHDDLMNQYREWKAAQP